MTLVEFILYILIDNRLGQAIALPYPQAFQNQALSYQRALRQKKMPSLCGLWRGWLVWGPLSKGRNYRFLRSCHKHILKVDQIVDVLSQQKISNFLEELMGNVKR